MSLEEWCRVQTRIYSGAKQAVIDHMFANSKIANFRVIVDELDLSDHRPIA